MHDSKRKSQCLQQQTGCTEDILLRKQREGVFIRNQKISEREEQPYKHTKGEKRC